jgi:hypothetical protein
VSQDVERSDMVNDPCLRESSAEQGLERLGPIDRPTFWVAEDELVVTAS